MLQTANTDLFNPLVPKAHNFECQNPLFPSQSDIYIVFNLIVAVQVFAVELWRNQSISMLTIVGTNGLNDFEK